MFRNKTFIALWYFFPLVNSILCLAQKLAVPSGETVYWVDWLHGARRWDGSAAWLADRKSVPTVAH